MATFRSTEMPTVEDLGRIRSELRKQLDLVFAVLMEEVESDRTDRMVRLAEGFMLERDDALALNRELESKLMEAGSRAGSREETLRGIADDLRFAVGRYLGGATPRTTEDATKLAEAVAQYDKEIT